MLRRLKNDESGGSASGAAAPAESGGDEAPDGGAAGQMSSLQKYRSQTMKDYGLMIEYKHLRQHVPAGIYVLPSFDQGRVWYGVIFVHTGLYRNGIFKFTIYLPEDYNGPGTYPQIVFNTNVYHPYVFPETKELDLKPKFPEWDPELHYMVAVLTYLKSIFYLKDFPQTEAIANPDALEMFRHNPEEYVENVESSVETSLENVYNNEQGSTIRFTKHSPAHDHLRQELFAQLESKPEVKDRPSETLEEKLAVPPPSASMSLVTATVAAAAATSEGTTVSEEPMPDAGMSP